MYRSKRMTDGSLKLIETPRISLSYTEITSTFRWHQSVTAFCQSTILRGSYDAFRRSVCSISVLRLLSAFLGAERVEILPDGCRGVKAVTPVNTAMSAFTRV